MYSEKSARSSSKSSAISTKIPRAPPMRLWGGLWQHFETHQGSIFFCNDDLMAVERLFNQPGQLTFCFANIHLIHGCQF